ncbi:hypothetical protein [Flavobacterium sp. ov086]|uniref:hypothetical protein n=1 Tax=Flavobacterium sp. ov086 TaxID=1761785 RepID=UPI000B7079D7|nr:hypothetical protein [Flavobacterium sp. ov086]SNR80640.1 hypothetical protein SAMN04487979_12269 [Flavobacterium sp. ov086]
MLKKLLFTSLFLTYLTSFSQEVVHSTPVVLKNNRDVFQTVDNDKKQVTLFISDKIKVKAFLLNDLLQITDSISTERPDRKKFTEIIGYNTNNSNVRLFWSSRDRNLIFTQLYDFKTRKITTEQTTLFANNEEVLESFSSKNRFYSLSLVKQSNILKLHVFDQDGDHETKIINFSNYRFYKRDNSKTDLYGVFEEPLLPYENSFSLQNITTENPTSITDGAKKRKCYFNENQLIITLDSNIDFTQIYTIDLKTYTVTEKVIQKPLIMGGVLRTSLNSNSFLIDNKLYQIKTSPDQFYFTIKDLDGNVLKEFNVTTETPIDFKNSEISVVGSDFGGTRVLETSSQFIRKINKLSPGISCYHIGENTLITLGSASETKQAITPMYLGGGLIGVGLSAAAGGIMGYYNSTLSNFNSYSNRKVVKIDCLFDKDNNHVKSELQPLAFDKIRTFFDAYKDVSSQTLFKMENYYYLGYYDNRINEYVIRRFAD